VEVSDLHHAFRLIEQAVEQAVVAAGVPLDSLDGLGRGAALAVVEAELRPALGYDVGEFLVAEPLVALEEPDPRGQAGGSALAGARREGLYSSHWWTGAGNVTPAHWTGLSQTGHSRTPKMYCHRSRSHIAPCHGDGDVDDRTWPGWDCNQKD
jgi:hypothetical protein